MGSPLDFRTSRLPPRQLTEPGTSNEAEVSDAPETETAEPGNFSFLLQRPSVSTLHGAALITGAPSHRGEKEIIHAPRARDLAAPETPAMLELGERGGLMWRT